MRWGYGCGSFRAGVRVISGFSRLLRAAVWPPGDAGAQRSLSPPCWYSLGSGATLNLSETVPGSARGMQRFLTDSPWDDEVIIGRLQGTWEPGWSIRKGCGCWTQRLSQAGEEVGGSGPAVLREAGEGGQLQAGMFLAYVSPLGRALVDKGLFCPRVGPLDKDRCEAAGAAGG